MDSKVVGSNPASPPQFAWLAQSVEQLAVNQWAVGSSPTPGANMGRYTVSGSGADCKSAALGSGGSTPSLSTRYYL